MGKKLNTKIFIERSEKVHKNKFDYSKSVYVGATKPITIICPEHGEFVTLPYNHMNGHGCFKCRTKPPRTLRWSPPP